MDSQPFLPIDAYARFQEKPWTQDRKRLTSKTTTLEFLTSKQASKWRDVLNAPVEFGDSPETRQIRMLIDGDSLGYLSWTTTDGLKITNIKIVPKYRGLGYGTLLMSYFLNTITGNEEVRLEIDDPGLIEFYEPFGFQVVREVDADFPESPEELEEIIQRVEETGGWLEMVRPPRKIELEKFESDTVFITDLDGTLTFRPGIHGQEYLGHPLSPGSATNPLQEFTRKLVRIMFDTLPGSILTRNTEPVARGFLEWAGVDQKVPVVSTEQKLEAAREQIRTSPAEFIYVFEDGVQILQHLQLEFPERVIPVPCYQYDRNRKQVYPLPQMVLDFIGSRRVDHLTEEKWLDFLDHRFDQYDPNPWIRTKELIAGRTYRLGPSYITIHGENKPLFRIKMEDWNVYRPTGKKSLGSVYEFQG